MNYVNVRSEEVDEENIAICEKYLDCSKIVATSVPVFVCMRVHSRACGCVYVCPCCVQGT